MSSYPFQLSVTSATSTHLHAEGTSTFLRVDAADAANTIVQYEDVNGVTIYAVKGELLSPRFRHEVVSERMALGDCHEYDEGLWPICELAALWAQRSSLTVWDDATGRYLSPALARQVQRPEAD